MDQGTKLLVISAVATVVLATTLGLLARSFADSPPARPQPVFASSFNGAYSDPNHPQGWRTIQAIGPDTVFVAGVDDIQGPAWWTHASVSDGVMSMDFSKKTHGKVGVLEAKVVKGGIEFPDGNVWTKVDAGGSKTVAFEGIYFDPSYPEGWRSVAAGGDMTTIVTGVDQDGGSAWWIAGLLLKDSSPSTARFDSIDTMLLFESGKRLRFDFSDSKTDGGRDGVLEAILLEGGIQFSNGTVWEVIDAI